MAFKIIEGSEVASNRSSHVLKDGEIAIDGNSLYVGDGSTPGGVQINAASSSTFDAQTITANGSTNSASPTELDAGKSAYIWARSFGSSAYFSLPNGTEVGQRTILIGRSYNSGSNVQIKYTGYTNGSPDATKTTSVDTIAGNNNKEMLWDGSAWYFLNKQ